MDTIRREAPDDYSKFYGHRTFCGNCGSENHCYVLKGVPLKGQRITCDKCGCGIRLQSHGEVWSE